MHWSSRSRPLLGCVLSKPCRVYRLPASERVNVLEQAVILLETLRHEHLEGGPWQCLLCDQGVEVDRLAESRDKTSSRPMVNRFRHRVKRLETPA
jgi:hypothetical protein